MKVLFICSGNSSFGVMPFIRVQGDSIAATGIDLEYFVIKDKGVLGYLRNVGPLRKMVQKNDYDVLHAHYGLSGLVAWLAMTGKPIVQSFMGSDVYGEIGADGKRKLSSNLNVLIAKVLQFLVQSVIVKSENLRRYFSVREKLNIVPNGVNFDTFCPMSKKDAREKLGWTEQETVVLFLGDPKDPRKNIQLLHQAVSKMDHPPKVVNPYPLNHKDIPTYLNAADLFALASYQEGSPNVVKEAMACNCPIVSTDVGDVKQIIGKTPGCSITSFEPGEVANAISEVLAFKDTRTNGRDAINHLSAQAVAERVISIYRSISKTEK